LDVRINLLKDMNYQQKTQEKAMPTGRPPLVGEAIANFLRI
jgi:hypothetical protein